jgi:hypothetical protein
MHLFSRNLLRNIIFIFLFIIPIGGAGSDSLNPYFALFACLQESCLIIINNTRYQSSKGRYLLKWQQYRTGIEKSIYRKDFFVYYPCLNPYTIYTLSIPQHRRMNTLPIHYLCLSMPYPWTIHGFDTALIRL